MAEQQSTHTEVAHEGGGHGAFPPFNTETFPSQLLWLALCFGALYLLMSRVALPRVGGVIEARRDKVASQLDAAAAMQAQAKQASEAHDRSIADARAKAQATAQAARDKLAGEADASRRSLEAELNAKLATAESQIAETTTRAMANVETIAADATAAIVRRLIGKSVEPDAIARALAAAKQG